jgi:hypothetical protein
MSNQLNLPTNFNREAEEMAERQGVSLNQFTIRSASEKVAALRQQLDDPKFPGITYRRGASGWVTIPCWLLSGAVSVGVAAGRKSRNTNGTRGTTQAGYCEYSTEL